MNVDDVSAVLKEIFMLNSYHISVQAFKNCDSMLMAFEMINHNFVLLLLVSYFMLFKKMSLLLRTDCSVL